MAIVSVSVPDELKELMDQKITVNWSGVARKAFEKELSDRELFEKVANESQLTEEDAKKLADTINRNVGKRFMKLHEARNRR